MTRVFPNHFRFGSTRALGNSLDWYEAALVTFPAALCCALPPLNMFRVLTFFADLFHDRKPRPHFQ